MGGFWFEITINNICFLYRDTRKPRLNVRFHLDKRHQSISSWLAAQACRRVPMHSLLYDRCSINLPFFISVVIHHLVNLQYDTIGTQKISVTDVCLISPVSLTSRLFDCVNKSSQKLRKQQRTAMARRWESFRSSCFGYLKWQRRQSDYHLTQKPQFSSRVNRSS